MSKRLSYFQHVGKLIRTPWLERHGKTWVMTDEGRRVLPMVEDLLRRYDHMLAFLEAAAPAGLTFACGREAAETFVLEALKKFRKDRPDTVYRVIQARGRERIEGVANGLYSMAVVTHDQGQIEKLARGRPLHVEDLHKDPLVLACAKGSRWAADLAAAKDGKGGARALARFPLILPEPNAGIREKLDERLRKDGAEAKLQVALEIGGWGTIRRYAAAGLGVGLMPASVAGDGLVVNDAMEKLLPRNVSRLVCRKRPGTDDLDLNEEEAAFLAVLRAEARKP